MNKKIALSYIFNFFSSFFFGRTSRAMKGEIPFHTSLVQRLDIVQPSVSIITKYMQMNPPKLTPGIK